jgi:two-component system nitrogen regulation response regulator NtrX
MKLFSEAEGTPIRLSEDALRVLVAYDWPGNVRELKNNLERLVILSSGPEIGLDDLPDEITSGNSEKLDLSKTGQSLKTAKSDFERSYILGKLEECDWNVSKTADALNIERSNLHRKLKSYDIDPKKLKG